jgi:hypothetical protein
VLITKGKLNGHNAEKSLRESVSHPSKANKEVTDDDIQKKITCDWNNRHGSPLPPGSPPGVV